MPVYVGVYRRIEAKPQRVFAVGGLSARRFHVSVQDRGCIDLMTCYIFADLMVLFGRDAYHAQMTETLLLVFLLTPLVIRGPYLLAQWDKFKRADNARRRAAQRRRMERTAR